MAETTVRRTIVEDAYFDVDNGGLHTGLLEQVTTGTEPDQVSRALQLIFGYSHFGVMTDCSTPLLNVAHVDYLMSVLAKARTMMEARPEEFYDHKRADVRPHIGVTGGLRVKQRWASISGADRETLVGHEFYDQITGEQIRFRPYEGSPVERPAGGVEAHGVAHDTV